MAEAIAARTRLTTLGLLWLVYVVHSIDRGAILVLLEPIRRSFALSDSQLGLIGGLAYAIPYALSGLVLGRVADRVNRIGLISALLAIWSMMTALAGAAFSFGALLLARAGIGASEGGGPAAMLAVIGDTFEPARRPAAISFQYTAPFAGTILGSAIAGIIASAHGWRWALVALGVPGILLAAIVRLVLRDPVRIGEARAGGEPMRLKEALRRIAANPLLLRITIAITLGNFTILGMNSWVSVLLQRDFGLSPKAAGIGLGLALGVAGWIGTLAGGLIATRYGKGDAAWLRRYCGTLLLIATPLAILAPLARDATIVLVLVGTWSFFSTAFIGPSLGLVFEAAPATARATVIAVVLVISNLVGAGLGPQFVGLVSDLLRARGDAAGLAHAMALDASLGFVIAALFLHGARRAARATG